MAGFLTPIVLTLFTNGAKSILTTAAKTYFGDGLIKGAVGDVVSMAGKAMLEKAEDMDKADAVRLQQATITAEQINKAIGELSGYSDEQKETLSANFASFMGGKDVSGLTLFDTAAFASRFIADPKLAELFSKQIAMIESVSDGSIDSDGLMKGLGALMLDTGENFQRSNAVASGFTMVAKESGLTEVEILGYANLIAESASKIQLSAESTIASAAFFGESRIKVDDASDFFSDIAHIFDGSQSGNQHKGAIQEVFGSDVDIQTLYENNPDQFIAQLFKSVGTKVGEGGVVDGETLDLLNAAGLDAQLIGELALNHERLDKLLLKSKNSIGLSKEVDKKTNTEDGLNSRQENVDAYTILSRVLRPEKILDYEYGKGVVEPVGTDHLVHNAIEQFGLKAESVGEMLKLNFGEFEEYWKLQNPRDDNYGSPHERAVYNAQLERAYGDYEKEHQNIVKKSLKKFDDVALKMSAFFDQSTNNSSPYNGNPPPAVHGGEYPIQHNLLHSYPI